MWYCEANHFPEADYYVFSELMVCDPGDHEWQHGYSEKMKV